MLEATLPLLEELGDRFGEAQVYSLLGNYFADQNELEQSLRYYDQSVEIYRELGTAGHVMKTLGNMGTVYHLSGDFDQAARLYQESLAVSRRLGDRLEMVYTLSNLGELAYDNLDEAAARQYLLEGLGYAVDLKVNGRIAYLLFWLGLLCSEGMSRPLYVAICLFTADHPALPRYDQKFLQETLAGQEIVAGVRPEAESLAKELDLEKGIALFLPQEDLGCKGGIA